MTAVEVLGLVGQALPEESYGELLRSGPHWLFELTIEVLTAPVAFVLGWVWRNGLLRHLHRDLHVLAHDPTRGAEVWLCARCSAEDRMPVGRGASAQPAHCVRVRHHSRDAAHRPRRGVTTP